MHVAHFVFFSGRNNACFIKFTIFGYAFYCSKEFYTKNEISKNQIQKCMKNNVNFKLNIFFDISVPTFNE